jgi:uncharacterized protein (PEP-CTERM system associated)
VASRVLVAGALAMAAAGASGQQLWHIEPALSTEFILTDNVNLAPSGQRTGDFVTQITPALRIVEKGAHTALTGSVSMPVLLYARTGSENNSVQPEVDLTGLAELYPRLLFVDGSIQVAPAYFSPFGARPQNLANATGNRYTTETYRVSPFIKGDAGATMHYELRDNNIWSSAGGTPIATNSSYTNEIIGHLTRDPTPTGWSLDYSRNDTKFTDQEPLLSELERASALWRPDPQWELSVDAGYENNRYPLAVDKGAIYGFGVKWHPTDRTTLDAGWEHRFFGGSYHVSFDHRMPLTVWSVRASRDITTYPQQLAALSAGSDVGALLNQLFIPRVTDPAQRQIFVDQFIRDRGLPATLSSPLALYSQQVTLQQILQASVGLIGARNTVFITGYRNRSDPVLSASPLSDLSSLQFNNTQIGANVVWTEKLTALYTLTTSADWVRTTDNSDAGLRSNQVILSSIVSAAISPVTTVYGGARFQRFISNVNDSYREAAAIVGINHIFR